jgi:hypothetical protein
MKKEFGGLGIPNIRELNLYLLGSWVRRYYSDDKKLWKQLVDYKYDVDKGNIFTYKEQGSSNFWKCVIWATKVATLGFGKTCGWAHLAWQPNTRNYTILLMSRTN